MHTTDCKGCDKKIRGTKQNLKVRVKEHQMETEKVSKVVVYTQLCVHETGKDCHRVKCGAQNHRPLCKAKSYYRLGEC